MISYRGLVRTFLGRRRFSWLPREPCGAHDQ